MLQAILAVSTDGAIGHQGKLPWTLPEDLKRFRSLTMGHSVLMGRKTYESIGRPLRGRKNIVITSQPKSIRFLDVHTFCDSEEALAFALVDDADPFVIGGAQLYQRFWARTGRVHLTEVHGNYPDADTRVPDVGKIAQGFHETFREDHGSYSFVTLERP